MHKFIVFACLFALVAVASAQIGLGLHGGAGYGSLGFGNIAGVNSNQNALGYQFVTREGGPLGGRVHAQAAHAPLGVGIPVVGGLGLGYGLGGGIIG
ncbi:hypothetical protein Ocin01_17885 [Orchesella cincta]|uniref:Uncharacterized protein n=1 Tax=Orchesella cincta TaxID=48709 RepID=A0A1D2M793_ORCCI|nr:hypothetical protein Ocin01_17885 [Orchesella cincta]